MNVIVRILHLPSDVQSGLYEATGTLFVSEENKNNDFIQQFLCQQSPLCLSISPYAAYALLCHPCHIKSLFLFSLLTKSVPVTSYNPDCTSDGRWSILTTTFIPFMDLDTVIYLAVNGQSQASQFSSKIS